MCLAFGHMGKLMQHIPPSTKQSPVILSEEQCDESKDPHLLHTANAPKLFFL